MGMIVRLGDTYIREDQESTQGNICNVYTHKFDSFLPDDISLTPAYKESMPIDTQLNLIHDKINTEIQQVTGQKNKTQKMASYIKIILQCVVALPTKT